MAQTRDSSGTVRILSNAKMARIVIDDSAYTGNQLAKIHLRPGKHKVTVENSDRIRFQDEDFVETIELSEGQDLELNVTFDRLGEINSYPYEASVTSSDRFLGQTPFYLDLSKFKSSILQFTKPGYETLSVAVDDSAMRKNYVFGALEPKIKDNRKGGDNQFRSIEWQEQGPRKHRTFLWITSMAGFVSGGLSAYYKTKADNAFEDAKLARRTGERDKQDRLEKKTKRYDNYALAGFIGLQINVGAIVYLLLKKDPPHPFYGQP